MSALRYMSEGKHKPNPNSNPDPGLKVIPALRYMSEGKHMGKILIDMGDIPKISEVALDSDSGVGSNPNPSCHDLVVGLNSPVTNAMKSVKAFKSVLFLYLEADLSFEAFDSRLAEVPREDPT